MDNLEKALLHKSGGKTATKQVPSNYGKSISQLHKYIVPYYLYKMDQIKNNMIPPNQKIDYLPATYTTHQQMKGCGKIYKKKGGKILDEKEILDKLEESFKEEKDILADSDNETHNLKNEVNSYMHNINNDAKRLFHLIKGDNKIVPQEYTIFLEDLKSNMNRLKSLNKKKKDEKN